MQEQYNSFDALEKTLLDRLKARGCSSITITGYRYPESSPESLPSHENIRGKDYYK